MKFDPTIFDGLGPVAILGMRPGAPCRDAAAMLTGSGVRIFAAQNIDDLLSSCSAAYPDLIFLDDEWLRIDERLPHRIKNLIPDENVRIIVIFTSPSPDVGLDAYTAMLQGCDDFLLWPCSGHELRARLHLSLRANRTFADLRRQRRDAASLLKLSQMLASSLDMRSILHTVSRLTADVVAFERCSIFLIGPAEGEVTLVAASEDAQMQELALPIAKYPELRTCIEQQRAVLIDDVQSDPLLGHVRSQIVEKGVRAMALFPIIFESQVLGVLFLRSSILSRLPSSLDMQFVQTVASSCAVAIRNAKLFESVREKASRVTSFQVLARKQSVLLKQYKNFFEAAADGMAIIDDKSKVIYLNREGRHLMDVDINDPEAMSEREIYFDDFLAPESQGQWQRLLQDVRVTHRHRMADVAVLLPDDRERRFSMAIGLAEKDTEFYVLSFRDVTMTRQMESELKTVKEFLEKLVDSSIDAIVATDTKGTILLFNKAAENLFGYTSDEVIGRIDASMLYAGGATNILRALYDERFGGVGKLDSHRSAIRSRSGEDIPVRMSASLLDDSDDGEEVIVCILADLRPQLEAEEQLEAARAKLHEAEKVQVVAELAGMAAHELNQPLTSVLGYAELIKNRYVNQANTAADDRMNHAVGVIYQQAMRMAEIVKKLGRITKYETKPYSGSTSIVDLDGSSKTAQTKNAAEQNYKTTKIHVPLHVVSANPVAAAKPAVVETNPTLQKISSVGVIAGTTTNPASTLVAATPSRDNKTFILDPTARNYQTPASLSGNGTAKQQRITQELRIPQFQHHLQDEKKAAAEKAMARTHENNDEKPSEKSLLSEQDDEITDGHLRRPRAGPKEGNPKARAARVAKMAVRAVVVLELWLSMEVVVLRSLSSIRSVVSAVVRATVLTAVAFAALPAVAQNPVLSDPTGTVGDANVVGTLPERFASRYKKGPLSMSFIGIERTNSEERLVIQLNRPAEFDLKTSPDGASVYVEIPTAQIPHSNNQNRLDATYFPGAIKLVQARSVRDIGGKRGIRVTIDLKSKALLESKIEGTNIVLIFRPS